jgi:hypothetical protein
LDGFRFDHDCPARVPESGSQDRRILLARRHTTETPCGPEAIAGNVDRPQQLTLDPTE